MAIPTGKVSEKYESGGRGVSTVSTGNGDFGGVSYGKHQLASNNGSMQKFLNSEFGKPYKHRFQLIKDGGVAVPMESGTPEFSAVYKMICMTNPKEFEAAQFNYIIASHYVPQVELLTKNGINVADRHIAVAECVLSVAVQYGKSTSLIVEALGIGFKGSDEDFIKRVQKRRRDTVNVRFKSSSQKVRDSVVERSKDEEADLLKLLKT